MNVIKRHWGKIIAGILLIGYILIILSFLIVNKKPKSDHSNGGASMGQEAVGEFQEYLDAIEKRDLELEMLRNTVDALNGNVSSLNKQLMEATSVYPSPSRSSPAVRPGVIILGMHRSGTSVVGGLMSKMGLQTGGPLIHAAFDNKKGFFERIDVVLQNDASMTAQGVWYSTNTYKFDAQRGIKDILDTPKDGKHFAEGSRGLKFLNDVKSYPWMLKDPRLCITLRMWLPLLNFVPAILFTYRHPMDVALSMNKRETEHFTVQRGLKIWYIYNKRAVQQSKDLCRVTTSHRKVMNQPEVCNPTLLPYMPLPHPHPPPLNQPPSYHFIPSCTPSLI